ncbi:MAG: aminopeptidase [Desulfurococcales archaeon]|nr:aminopeptidase [Desulfurococcales archaeon]
MSVLKDLDKFAELIIDYCIGVREKDEVMVSATVESMELVREVYKGIVSRGGLPHLRITSDVFSELFYRYAPKSLLEYVSPIEKFVMENIDAVISIMSPQHVKPLAGVDPERLAIAARARGELSEIFMKRHAEGSLRWVLTAYPTYSMAQEAGMGLIELEEFMHRALKLYAEDPASAWREQARYQDRIASLLSRVSELRYVGEGIDLYINVEGRRWINDDGKNNMPGGEVFTGPHEDSAEGYIEFDYPAIWRGIEFGRIKLVFKRGEVVEAHSEKAGEHLEKLLSTDEGSRRIGELAFGLNYDITRQLKNILFDEKIGGTMHIALGASYPDTGGRNKSSIHFDIIKGLGKAKVYGDGDLIYENGRFLLEVA